MRGGNVLALGQILGHAKVSLTEKYAHLTPDDLAWTSPGPSASWNHSFDPDTQPAITLSRK